MAPTNKSAIELKEIETAWRARAESAEALTPQERGLLSTGLARPSMTGPLALWLLPELEAVCLERGINSGSYLTGLVRGTPEPK